MAIDKYSYFGIQEVYISGWYNQLYWYRYYKSMCIVAKLDENGNVEILGRATEPCSGVKKGVIVDIDSVSNALKVVLKDKGFA